MIKLSGSKSESKIFYRNSYRLYTIRSLLNITLDSNNTLKWLDILQVRFFKLFSISSSFLTLVNCIGTYCTYIKYDKVVKGIIDNTSEFVFLWFENCM